MTSGAENKGPTEPWLRPSKEMAPSVGAGIVSVQRRALAELAVILVLVTPWGRMWHGGGKGGEKDGLERAKLCWQLETIAAARVKQHR